MPIVEPIFPPTGRNVVEPISWFQIKITNETAFTLADIDLYMSFGAQSDPAYPVSPDYYGATIDKNILTALPTLEDPVASGFFRLGYWSGASFDFEAPANVRSTASQVSDTEIRLDVRFDQPLGYNVQHSMRVRVGGTNQQVLQFNTVPRPFFSPAIGDVQSGFEAAIETPTYGLVLPECLKLHGQAIRAFDDRATILAARRMARISLQRQLGFSDLVSEALQIRQDFRTLVFQEVAEPKSLANIDLSLGNIALQQADRALKELATKKEIPKEWWEPISKSLDFARIDLTFRVRVVAQIVAIAARAAWQGII